MDVEAVDPKPVRSCGHLGSRRRGSSSRGDMRIDRSTAGYHPFGRDGVLEPRPLGRTFGISVAVAIVKRWWGVMLMRGSGT